MCVYSTLLSKILKFKCVEIREGGGRSETQSHRPKCEEREKPVQGEGRYEARRNYVKHRRKGRNHEIGCKAGGGGSAFN
jgi:hypothetical protein